MQKTRLKKKAEKQGGVLNAYLWNLENLQETK